MPKSDSVKKYCQKKIRLQASDVAEGEFSQATAESDLFESLKEIAAWTSAGSGSLAEMIEWG